MRKIKNGKLGPVLVGGCVQFDFTELWKHVQTVGGPDTQRTVGTSKVVEMNSYARQGRYNAGLDVGKGEPPQMSSRSLRAPATTVLNQSVINPMGRV